MAVYRHAVHDPADNGVYEALVRHFAEYSLAFIARCTHPDLPDTNHEVIAQFMAHGFAGAIKAWLRDDSVTRADLVTRPSPVPPTGGADTTSIGRKSL